MRLFGTSGWAYSSWRGPFYPPLLKTSEWLVYYAAEFPVVEVNVQHAVEFRHPSWQCDAATEALAARGVMTVNVSGPQYPASRIATGARAYIRFHGLEAGYAHDYTADELAPWAEHVAAQRDALVFFNNDAGGRAVQNARLFRQLVAARRRGQAA